MEVDKSFRTSEKRPIGHHLQRSFFRSYRDSACDGVVVFGSRLDSDPTGRTTALYFVAHLELRFRGVHFASLFAIPGSSSAAYWEFQQLSGRKPATRP